MSKILISFSLSHDPKDLAVPERTKVNRNEMTMRMMTRIDWPWLVDFFFLCNEFERSQFDYWMRISTVGGRTAVDTWRIVVDKKWFAVVIYLKHTSPNSIWKSCLPWTMSYTPRSRTGSSLLFTVLISITVLSHLSDLVCEKKGKRKKRKCKISLTNG